MSVVTVPIEFSFRDVITVIHNLTQKTNTRFTQFRPSLSHPMRSMLFFAGSSNYTDYSGDYAGFDENEPTSKSGGKAEVIRRIKEQRAFKTVIHIGDGATDLEACPPADAFIGFGGNVIRESVKTNALWFVMNFNDLLEVLEDEENI